MGRNIKIIVANPAGNITLMVLTPVDRKEYREITSRLLAMKFRDAEGVEVSAEQVCFILSDGKDGQYPSMEMSGLEFCGNASRTFAYYIAGLHNPPLESVTVKVSGCVLPLTSATDLCGNKSCITMPLPDNVEEISPEMLSLTASDTTDGNNPQKGIFVAMDGISHMILRNIKATEEIFTRIKDRIYSNIDLPAFGIMFTYTDSENMTPVVYVRDVDTTYFEGSCASGTTAASCAFAYGASDGIHHFVFHQPEGTLESTVTKENGQIVKVELDGSVTLSSEISVSI